MVKKTTSKKRTSGSAGKQVKKPIKPAVKKSAPSKTVKKPASKKAATKAPAAKKAPEKKPVKKAAAVKKAPEKKAAPKPKPIANPILKPVPVPKPEPSNPAPDKSAPVQQPNLGLPEGSEYQQNGHRRPLIVFPK